MRRNLIIPNSVLRTLADLPEDFKVVSGGVVTGLEGYGGVFAAIESDEFKDTGEIEASDVSLVVDRQA